MTYIDLNRLRGNYAEHSVAAALSRVCLVRPVAEGTDIGVDLYCESLLGGTPFLHFWVQVKAIDSKHIGEESGKVFAWYDFQTRHLRYWERQPIPMYAFLVLVDQWPPSPPRRFYTVRITEQIVRNGIPDRTTVRLKAFEWADVETIDTDLQQFITQVVPWDNSILLLRKGVVVPMPKIQPEDEDRYPIEIGFQYVQEMSENIRDASIIGLLNSMVAEDRFPERRALRKRFQAIAELYEEDLHNFGLSMLVRAAHTDGDIQKAKAYIHDAAARIEADSGLDAEVKKARIEKISALLADFQ